MKQTAVEWYGEAIINIYNEYMGGQINHEGLLQNLLNARLQAKAMEKEQIIDAYCECWSNDGGDGNRKVKEAEQYYNETFKKL